MKNRTINTLALILGMVFAAWVILFFLLIEIDNTNFIDWICFGAVAFSSIVAEISLLIINYRKHPSVTELNFLPVYYTVSYYIVSLAANTILWHFLKPEKGPKILLIGLNMLFFIVFIAMRLFAGQYGKRVGEQMNVVSGAISNKAYVSQRLATLLSICGDPEVRARLLKLKENVDYSNSPASPAMVDAERNLCAMLDNIGALINQKQGKDVILNSIGEAERAWNSRIR